LPLAPANDRDRQLFALSSQELMMQDVQDEPLFAERAAGPDIAKAGAEATVRVPSDTTAGSLERLGHKVTIQAINPGTGELPAATG
jgi:hypothetical protein